MKNVYIANDHAAVDLKNELCDYIESLGFHVVNLGTDEKTSVNYPEYAEKAAKAVLADQGSLGVLICGTGIGMSIAANKVHGIRAAAVSEVEAFLTTPFEGGRHQKRVDMITDIENRESK